MVFFFELIWLRAFGNMSMDFLWLSLLQLHDKLKSNSKILNFLILHPILILFFCKIIFMGYWWTIEYYIFISKRGLNSEILHIWKAYFTLEIVKQDKCPKYNGSSIFACSTHYCVRSIQCPHFHLICTCSTFPCWYSAVVSCFSLCIPFIFNTTMFMWYM